MLLLRAPGVYRPQGDTWMLASALRAAGMPRGARVLEVGTGTGALAVAAARLGAGSVDAFDVSRRAVWSARANAAVRRAAVRVAWGDALDRTRGREYDVIVSNPPYVCAASDAVPRRGRARAWDAGVDGRAVLDRLCAVAPGLLAPGGMLLVVHSALCGEDTTIARLRAGGLTASVVDRRHEPFGPVMRSRLGLLRERGLIGGDATHEELVVVRADRPSVDGARAAA